MCVDDTIMTDIRTKSGVMFGLKIAHRDTSEFDSVEDEEPLDIDAPVYALNDVAQSL